MLSTNNITNDSNSIKNKSKCKYQSFFIATQEPCQRDHLSHQSYVKSAGIRLLGSSRCQSESSGGGGGGTGEARERQRGNVKVNVAQTNDSSFSFPCFEEFEMSRKTSTMATKEMKNKQPDT